MTENTLRPSPETLAGRAAAIAGGSGQAPVVPRQCTAHSSRTGERCRHSAIHGAEVCWTHGGAAKHVRAAAERRVAAKQAADLAARFLDGDGKAGPPDIWSAMRQVIGEAIAFKQQLADRVSALSEKDWRYSSGQGLEQLRAELGLYERSLDRVGRFLELAGRLGMEERVAALNERMGLIVVDMFVQLMDELRLSDEQRHLAIDAVPRILQAHVEH